MPSLSLTTLQKTLRREAYPKKATSLSRYFKTGPGEYGEGDIFLGLSVPAQRRIAGRFIALSLADVARLLKSPIHEERFTALEILVMKFEAAGTKVATIASANSQCVVRVWQLFRRRRRNIEPVC